MKTSVKNRRKNIDWNLAGLSTIIKLNNIIGFLPIKLDEILSAVVREVYKLFSPNTCSIYMTKDGRTMELVALQSSDGLRPDIHKQDKVEFCAAIRDGLPFIVERKPFCPNRKNNAEGPMSHVCIPIIAGKDVLGTLSLDFDHDTVFTHDELNILLSITNQTAIAIQRSLLFEKLENEKAGLERAYKEIRELNYALQKKMLELKDTHDRLIQSEKLAATGELAAGLSHEINNPISIILNRIECLKMESKELFLPEVVLKDLNVIYSYAAKVSSIVHDLLIFSRHHSVEFKHVNIKAIIERVIEMLQNDLNKSRCMVHLNMSASVSDIYGDTDRLEQVFWNLLTNAIDAMPHGGNIYIEAESSRERPDFLEVRVSDGGEGIAEENLHRIFDPFFTTKKVGRGSGLGLSICFGIIKNHGGDITVKSVVNEGSVFTVYLPVKPS